MSYVGNPIAILATICDHKYSIIIIIIMIQLHVLDSMWQAENTTLINEQKIAQGHGVIANVSIYAQITCTLDNNNIIIIEGLILNQ